MPNADIFLVEAFNMSGVYESNGMGITPLTWSSIDGFCNRSTYDLEGWQAEIIIDMSRIYCSWINKGKVDICSSPWKHESEVDEIDQDRLMREAKALFRK